MFPILFNIFVSVFISAVSRVCVCVHVHAIFKKFCYSFYAGKLEMFFLFLSSGTVCTALEFSLP